jgi:hypothetical protein
MWTEQMKNELKSIFDAVCKRPEAGCTRNEILSVAARAGEDPEDLEDQIDLLEFDQATNLIEWSEFYVSLVVNTKNHHHHHHHHLCLSRTLSSFLLVNN